MPVQAKTLTISDGSAQPLGPSKLDDGINFALFAQHATGVTLCLCDPATREITELPLDPAANRTDGVWHAAVSGLPGAGVLYGFKVSGQGGWETGFRWDSSRILLDPYAPLVAGRRQWAVRDEHEDFQTHRGSQFWGTFDFESAPFDWGPDYRRPNLHPKDLVIYEMSVRCFTADPSSGLAPERRGTFLGVADKVDHLVSLGINAVELLPVFEYDELEFRRWPNPRDHMINVWGYSHMSFLAPMSRFAAAGGGPVAAAAEFKSMVRTLHAAGIEVILDVVYNHTAELDDKEPYLLSMRGIDSRTYYMVAPEHYVQLLNYSGCGNTVNANHPVVRALIIESLLRWVEEYHVDGFRFDLASCLCRDGQGNPIPAPPLIREIAKHPVLSKVKLIAEPWDLGMFQVGSFPNWDIWAEWNGVFRDDVRKFIKGDPGMKPAFATRLSGSADLYANHNRKPYHSTNFIIAHDGFSLYDLVAYNSKHNDANGENNNDGSNDNFSWNCGVEGETGDAGVMALRYRQMRNYQLALMLAQGTPMIVMGDEVAKSHGGNNNWYGHDNPMSWMQWDEADPAKQALLRFTSELIKFRKSSPLLGREEFYSPGDVTWHESHWEDVESRFLAFTIHDRSGANSGDIYAAFNAHTFAVAAPLPAPPAGSKWVRIVDTNLQPPKDFTPGGNSGVDGVYNIQPFSSIMLLSVTA